MTATDSTDDRRTVPVDPPVYVESFATPYTLTWTASSLSAFVAAIRGFDAVPDDATVVVDSTTVAGREDRPVGALDSPQKEATIFVGVESDAPWKLSWERRSVPVVSISGTPPLAVVRRAHLETTDCEEWPADATAVLRDLTATVRDEQ